MARRRRIGPQGIAQHLIQRGNNRSKCFASEHDFGMYVAWLKEFSEKFDVHIHAWVLMTNHVHLLCTPQKNNGGVSAMMQSLGRMYVRYFNKKYKRTGTLWEGRFKSILADSAQYVLTLYQYIELNPVRANMVSDPSEYKWSSYAINALGKESTLCHHHPLYLTLGETKAQRIEAYRSLFQVELDQALIDDIRKSTQKELVLGSKSFRDKIEIITGDTLKSDKLGRPFKIN